MDAGEPPTYDLAKIQILIREKRRTLTGSAAQGGWDLGFDASDIECCVLELTPAAFYKSMPAEKETFQGLWQDVYKTEYLGEKVYIKLQIRQTPQQTEDAIIISFKKDTDI